MTKNILQMIIRISIISALLYCSYYIYKHYTGVAVRMMDFDGVRIGLIIHSAIFFFLGVVFKFDTRLVFSIKNRAVKLNKVNIITAIGALIVLMLLKFNAFMYISVFVAFFAGVFLIESFECE